MSDTILAERQAKRKGTAYQAQVKKEMRWSVWKQTLAPAGKCGVKAEEMLKHLKSVVFPQLASLAKDESSFGDALRICGVECKTFGKPSLLVLSASQSKGWRRRFCDL